MIICMSNDLLETPVAQRVLQWPAALPSSGSLLEMLNQRPHLFSLCAWMFSPVQLFATLWTIAHQAPLSMRFSRQEYWSRLPFPPPGGSSQPRGLTWVSCFSCTGRWILYHWATRWNYPVINVVSRIHVPFILQIFIKSLLCTGACKNMKKNQT